MDNVTIIKDQSAAQIAQWIAQRLASTLADQAGQVAICVPGGSTPIPIFAALVKHDLDWTRIVVWPGDDRIVPEDHAASNTGKMRAAFEPAGARVQALSEDAAPPHFALCWLGMGGDGHIASLFPNTDPQRDDPQPVRRLTPHPLPPEAPFDRMTLTIPALCDADTLMFVISGDEKRAVFEAGMRGEHDLPIARLLGAAHQPVTCFT